jgi:hypothetical protein
MMMIMRFFGFFEGPRNVERRSFVNFTGLASSYSEDLCDFAEKGWNDILDFSARAGNGMQKEDRSVPVLFCFVMPVGQIFELLPG